MPGDVDELLRHLGGHLRRIREERGWSVARTAAASELSRRYYTQLEAGQANITVGRLAAVAAALDLSLSALFRALEPPQVVSLLGLRGAGKSTLGRRLARALGWPFYELDALVEERAGLSLDEIFALHDEGYYRRLEAQALGGLLSRNPACVVAVAGGLVQHEESFERLLRETICVWLHARPEDHLKRVLAQGDHRPVARSRDALSEIRQLLAQRQPLYRRAPIHVDTSATTVQQALRQVREALEDRGVIPRRRRSRQG